MIFFIPRVTTRPAALLLAFGSGLIMSIGGIFIFAEVDTLFEHFLAVVLLLLGAGNLALGAVIAIERD